MELKTKDNQILSLLHKDARIKLVDIKKEIGIPVSTIHERLKKLYPGVILKKTIILDFQSLGYNLCTILLIKSKEKTKSKDILESLKNCNTLYSISGKYDFLVEIVAKNLFEYEEIVSFLSNQPNISKVESLFVINTLKQNEFLPQ